MALEAEFEEFYTSWSQKISEYKGHSARMYFDKFLTQFVLFNRLYVEATFRLSRNERNRIQLDNREQFPDAKAAKIYVADYLGSRNLLDEIQRDEECITAFYELELILQNNIFFVKLHPVTGERQPNEDEILLEKLRSNSRATKAYALLEFIYCVRCNLMHGQKGFSEHQITLLSPLNILLNKICSLVYDKLSSVDPS